MSVGAAVGAGVAELSRGTRVGIGVGWRTSAVAPVAKINKLTRRIAKLTKEYESGELEILVAEDRVSLACSHLLLCDSINI